MINDQIEKLKCPVRMLINDEGTEFRRLKNCHFLVDAKFVIVNRLLRNDLEAFKEVLELSYSASGDVSRPLGQVSVLYY